MTIKLVFPTTSTLSFAVVPDLVDFLAIDANVTGFSTTSFTGGGSFSGNTVSFSISGSNFATQVINGQPIVSSGVIDKISVTFIGAGAGGGNALVQFSDVALDLAIFTPIVLADVTGSAPFGIENLLLGRAWDVTLGGADDVATKNTILGDGVKLNLLGNDVIRGMGGNDNLFSGDGNDTVFGGLGNDRLDGGNGNDIVYGDDGNDKIKGGGGSDMLFGCVGRDNIKGGGGGDIIDLGQGRDVAIGGKGADVFVFGDGYGTNRIKDFAARNNKEDIDLSKVAEITGFKDLARNHMKQSGDDVIINNGAGTKVILVGVDLGDLGAQDFLF